MELETGDWRAVARRHLKKATLLAIEHKDVRGRWDSVESASAYWEAVGAAMAAEPGRPERWAEDARQRAEDWQLEQAAMDDYWREVKALPISDRAAARRRIHNPSRDGMSAFRQWQQREHFRRVFGV